jgi:hypothetical protein
VIYLTHGLLAMAIAFAGLLSHRGAEDQRGLRTMQALAASGRITSSNSLVIVDAIRPPDAPRRNDPMPDSVYYYFGLSPAIAFMPQSRADLRAERAFVFVRRKRIYEQTLRDMGLRELARSTKIALFSRP